MVHAIASRTPEGDFNTCPVCHAVITLEPSQPSGDAPCPQCGVLLWFTQSGDGVGYIEGAAIEELRQEIVALVKSHMSPDEFQDSGWMEFAQQADLDSLEFVELLMKIDSEFELPRNQHDLKLLQQDFARMLKFREELKRRLRRNKDG